MRIPSLLALGLVASLGWVAGADPLVIDGAGTVTANGSLVASQGIRLDATTTGSVGQIATKVGATTGYFGNFGNSGGGSFGLSIPSVAILSCDVTSGKSTFSRPVTINSDHPYGIGLTLRGRSDATAEGGDIELAGAASHHAWSIDNFSGDLRVLSQGVVPFSLSVNNGARFWSPVNGISSIGDNIGFNYITCAKNSGHTILRDFDGSVANWIAYFKTGGMHVYGTITKGNSQFLIDHPLDPKNKNLRHSCIEAPRNDLIYRGTATLVKGAAEVSIDAAANMTAGTFAALTQAPQVFLQNDTGWEPVKGKVTGGTLSITCKDRTSTDTIAWMVVAERRDAAILAESYVDAQGRLIPESDKPTLDQKHLQPREALSAAETAGATTEPCYEARGTKGYPLHGKPEDLPRRQVRCREGRTPPPATAPPAR